MWSRYPNVTDRQTDEKTDGQTSSCRSNTAFCVASHHSHGKHKFSPLGPLLCDSFTVSLFLTTQKYANNGAKTLQNTIITIRTRSCSRVSAAVWCDDEDRCTARSWTYEPLSSYCVVRLANLGQHLVSLLCCKPNHKDHCMQTSAEAHAALLYFEHS